MKHLIHKNHYPHLKKRALLEIMGMFFLFVLAWSQRGIIQNALATISKVDAVWLILLLAGYWLIMPLTALSYRLITPKPKRFNMFHAILAHVAGSGPGKIIPGGIGNISISALHIRKTGLSIEQSLAVVVTNNIMGLMTSLVLLGVVLLLQPEITQLIATNVSSQQLVVGIIGITALAVGAQWMLHARGTSKEAHKVLRQWRKLLVHFIRRPKNVLGVISLSFVITLIQVLLLDLSGYALGLDLAIYDAFIALSIGVAIGGVLPTPGGIGGVEAGITAGLIALGHDPTLATSIALLYRVATYWQPIVPGILAYLYLRERKLL